jgi:hypothetical protein
LKENKEKLAVSSETVKVNSELFIDGYHAVYQPGFDPAHTVVEIFSKYPWDYGTLQLLKTIHVEKIIS